MGRGTILSAGEDGDYTLSLDYGSEKVGAYIAALQSLETQYAEAITAAEESQAEAAALALSLKSAMNAEINAYKVAEEKDGKALQQATRAYNQQQLVADKWQRNVNFYTGQLAGVQARIAKLQGLSLTESRDTWCVDYTLDAIGEVATIEINGEQPVILVGPGGEAPTAADGLFTSREALTPEAAYLNAALLPGWQKWMPTYRLGQLSSIDRSADTGTVELDAALSSAQSLDINQEAILYDVPIEYMSCNAAAFEVWDRVVVKFEGQDWASPKVIGFESNPKPCTGGVLRYIGTPESGAPNPTGWIVHFPQAAHQVLLDNLRLTAVSAITLPYSKRVLVEFREQGESDWILCPPSGVHYYNEGLNVIKQGSLFNGVPGYEPVRWDFDVKYIGTVSPLVELFDVSGEVFHLADEPQPTNTSVEDNYYFAYLRNMGYDVSEQHTKGGVMAIIKPFNFGEWPDHDPAVAGYEFRIRDNPLYGGRVHMHCAINRDNQEAWGFSMTDLLAEAVPRGLGRTAPYWLHPSYTPTAVEYSPPEDGVIWYYGSSGTLVNSGL